MPASAKLIGFGNIRHNSRLRPAFSIDDLLVIGALTRRYARLRSIREPTGVLSEFFRPTAICIAHYFIFLFVSRQFPPGISLEEVIWAAFPVWFVFNRIYADIQMPHILQVPRMPGVSRMHLRIAIAVWAVVVNALFCYGSVIIMRLFGDTIRFPDISLMSLMLVLSAMLALGLGMTFEAIGRVVPFLHPVFHLMPYFSFISAGLYFSASNTPQQMAAIFLYNPLLHLIEYARSAFDPAYPTGLISMRYAVLCALGSLALGLAVNRRFRRTTHE